MDIAEILKPAIVAILDNRGEVFGTGFFITSDGYILTCYHVIRKGLSANKVDIKTEEGKRISVTFHEDKSCLDYGKDFAILKAEGKEPFPCLALGKDFEKGDVWHSRGYNFPIQYKDVACKGIIVQRAYRQGIDRGYDILGRADDPIKGGLSGSPLLIERAGLVAGIISARPNEMGDEQIFATPVKDVFAKWPDLKKLNSESSSLIHITIESTPKDVTPRIFNVPLQRNINFAGRNDILTELSLALNSGERGKWKHAIWGLGGVGKSQLAVEYAYLHRENYRIVWWVRSEDPSTLLVDYADLAKSLGLKEGDFQDLTEVATAVKKWLEVNTGWLLIFDNAQETEHIKNYLPGDGPGHVIITSRNPEWGSLARSFHLKVFKREESVDFLLKRNEQFGESVAEDLSDCLGDLPLALEQAASYMDATSTSIDEYIEMFKTQRQRLWKEEHRPQDYPDTVATTWSLSMERVRQEAGAADILNLCAFLSSERIPVELLAESAKDLSPEFSDISVDRFAFKRAIRILKRYSLIETNGKNLDVHSLVQMAVRDNLGEDCRPWAKKAVELLSSGFPFNRDDPETWDRSALLLPHALAVAEHAKQLGVAAKATQHLLNQLGLYLENNADFRGAEIQLERALPLAEKVYGPYHPEVAAILNSLGTVLQGMGELQEARKCFEKALRIDEKMLGPDNQVVSAIINNLSMVLKDLSELQEARKYLERALLIDERVFGPDHLHVATVFNNLGMVLKDLGELQEARKYLERALLIDERVFGPDHPYVATIVNNLGMVLKDLGELQEAKKYFVRGLQIDEKVYGPYHSKVAADVNNFGLVLRDLGKQDEAKKYFGRALQIDEKVFGPDNLSVARDINNLGSILQDLGELREARKCFERALRICMLKLGKDHPNTNLVKRNLESLDY